MWNARFGFADSCRYAEMDKQVKNKISHRCKALEKLKTWLMNTN